MTERLATNRGENLDDLFQVGTIGLMKAIDNFDISQNVRFSTYAVPMIIGEVRRYLRDNNTLRVSRSMRDTAYHAMQAKEHLQSKLNRDPTIEEIAAHLELPVCDVVIALEAIVEPVSLYEPVYSDGGDTIYVMDQVGGSESDSDWIDEIVIKETIRGLSPREKRILSLRFMQGKTQTEVAEEIGISQAQVSRLEKCANQRAGEIKKDSRKGCRTVLHICTGIHNPVGTCHSLCAMCDSSLSRRMTGSCRPVRAIHESPAVSFPPAEVCGKTSDSVIAFLSAARLCTVLHILSCTCASHIRNSANKTLSSSVKSRIFIFNPPYERFRQPL